MHKLFICNSLSFGCGKKFFLKNSWDRANMAVSSMLTIANVSQTAWDRWDKLGHKAPLLDEGGVVL